MKQKLALAVSGLLTGTVITLSPPASHVPDLTFGEHYHWLFYSLIIALKFNTFLLAPFFWTAGIPPFVEECFQSRPFDLGSSKFLLSFPVGLVLLTVVIVLTRRRLNQKQRGANFLTIKKEERE